MLKNLRVVNVIIVLVLTQCTLAFAQADKIKQEDKTKIAELLGYIRSAVQLQDATKLISRVYVDSTANIALKQMESSSLRSGLNDMFSEAVNRSYTASRSLRKSNASISSTYDFEVELKDFNYKRNPNQAELLLEVGFKYGVEDSTYLKEHLATSRIRLSERESARLLRYRQITLDIIKDQGVWWIESLVDLDSFVRSSFKRKPIE